MTPSSRVLQAESSPLQTWNVLTLLPSGHQLVTTQRGASPEVIKLKRGHLGDLHSGRLVPYKKKREIWKQAHGGMMEGQRGKVVSASQEEGFKEEGAMPLRFQSACLSV